MARARTRAEQKDATRARLLKAARRVFARQGFDETSVALVCREAKITHGALYHHFPGKAELFAAVVEAMFAELGEVVLNAVGRRTGWDQVEAACSAYLDACADPAVQAIVFRDGPRVMPRVEFDAIDRQASEPMVARLLGQWIASGLLKPVPIEFLARTIGAAFAEAGAIITQAEDAAHARVEVGALLASFMRSLRRAPEEAPRLATERLRLEPWSPVDLPALCALIREPRVRRYLFDDQVMDAAWVESATRASEASFAAGGVGLWVARRGDGTLVGFAGFGSESGRAAELVFAVATAFMGKGYGAEMAKAAIREAYARGVPRIEANTDEANEASIRLLSKLGFVRSGTRRGPKGTLFDYVLPR
jgi:RimJ/RimL family protein N-acetyltransferase